MENTAKEYFLKGKNCAQAVLMTFADRAGLSEDEAFALASGFGGGIAKQGEVCGAVSGAAMVLSLIYGKPGNDPEAAKVLAEEKVDAFIKEFKTRKSSIICRDLIDGLEIGDADDRKEWADKNMKTYSCLPAVTTAVEILNDLV